MIAGYNNLVRPVINSGLKLSLGTGMDIGKTLVSKPNTIDYNQLKSPFSKLAAQTSKNTIKNTPRGIVPALSAAGEVANDVLNVAMPGNAENVIKNAGENTFKNITKQGFKTGLKFGLSSGVAQGVQGDFKNVKEQLKSGLVSGLEGGAIGGVAGGALAAGGYGGKAAVKLIKSGAKNEIIDMFAHKLINRPVSNFIETVENGITVRKPREGTKYEEIPASQLRSVLRGEPVIKSDYKAPQDPVGVHFDEQGKVESVSTNNPVIQDYIKSWSTAPGFVKVPGEPNIPQNSSERFPNQETTPKSSLPESTTPISIESPNNPPTNSSQKVSFGSNIPPEQQLVNDTKAVLTGSQTKERGFVTSVKTSSNTPKVLKDMVSGTYVPKTTAELKAQAANLIKTDINAAEQVAINPTSDVHIQIGNELLNHYATTGQLQKAKTLAEAMSNSGTEFGRAVQAFANYDKTTPEGAIRFAQSTIDKFNRENPTNKLSLSKDTITQLFNKGREIGQMAEGRERNIASQQLMNQVNDLIPSTIQDKAINVWKAGLLTSFRTTLRNIVGNTVHGIAEVAKDAPATIADMVMNLRTGKRTLTPTLKGVGQGIKTGWGRASDIMTLGFDPEKTIEKFDIKRISWGNNPVEQTLKKGTDLVFNWMGAQDKLFYHSAFARSLYDQAGAAAINAGRSGDTAFVQSLVDKASTAMKETATKDALIAVFQDKNALSKMINGLKSKAGNARWITDFFAPFTGVPSSIAGQMVSYSPIGLVKGGWNTVKVLAGKTPELQRQAAQEVGRGVVGTAIMGLAAVLASKGLITGQPKDAAEQRQWELEGKQANSVFVAGKWRSINSVGPEALIALAGAKLTTSKDKMQAAGNIGKDFLSQTFLSGVQQPLNAISDPARYAGTYLKSTVGSLIPNFVKDVSKAFDPLQRETNTVTDTLKSGIPILRNTLLPKRDAMGVPLPNETSGYKAFVDLFNSKTPVKDTVVNELSRLNVVGENATPSKLTANQTVYGQKLKLTPQELDQLEQQSGGAIRNVLETVVNNPTYKSLSDSDKATMLGNAVQDVRTGVKNDQVTGMGGFQSNNVIDKYKTQLQKDQFEKSGKNIQVIDGMVYRRNSDGSAATPIKEVSYNTQLTTQKLENAKSSKNLKLWNELSLQQEKNIAQQLNDPTLDELEKITLQQTYQKLIDDSSKYNEYGGFKKPKKAKVYNIAGVKKLQVKTPKGTYNNVKISKPRAGNFKLAPYKGSRIKSKKYSFNVKKASVAR